MSSHWILAPILIPLTTAALQLLLGQRRQPPVATSIISCVLLLASSMGLMLTVVATPSHAFAYSIGSWPARFAIVLVVDRLSALMLLLTAILALVVLPYAMGRWRYMGVYFQPLIQLLLVGFNGAFLTGDLFNLFVFFEVLLAASYGLALHGSGIKRVGASLHYIVINLTASMMFLLGVSLIFGVTGSLNMAVLATLVPTLEGNTLALFHGGAVLIGMAFLAKAAVWPLGFWLPRTYSAATPPVAALFALMTKLGIYVLLRLSLLLFGHEAGDSAHFGSHWLLWAGIITIVTSAIAALGTRELGRLAGYSVLISSGILLGAMALHEPGVTAGALGYIVVSGLGIAAFFLLIGLVVPEAKPEGIDQLEPYNPATDELFAHEDERRVTTPAPLMVLSACFLACTLLLAGLPPFPGFLAKYAMLQSMLGADTPGTMVLFASILASGLCIVIALCRAGIQIFWADDEWIFPHGRARETASVLTLLGVCGLLVVSGVPWAYLEQTAQQIHDADNYIQTVLEPARDRHS